MIRINNIFINKYQVDYFELNKKENTVYIHLQGGTSFLFSIEDAQGFINELTTGFKNDF